MAFFAFATACSMPPLALLPRLPSIFYARYHLSTLTGGSTTTCSSVHYHTQRLLLPVHLPTYLPLTPRAPASTTAALTRITPCYIPGREQPWWLLEIRVDACTTDTALLPTLPAPRTTFRVCHNTPPRAPRDQVWDGCIAGCGLWVNGGAACACYCLGQPSPPLSG